MDQLTPTTELQAVNLMLATIGEAPVNTLEVSGLEDVAAAKERLRNVTRTILTKGYKFNVDTNYPMIPDVNGNILIPPNMLKVVTTREYSTYDITQRNGMLYDRAKLTAVFDKTIYVDITWFFAYDTLPEPARWYIAVRAAREFQVARLGSESIARYTEKDEAEARSTFIDAMGETEAYNILTDNYTVASILER